MSHVEYRMTGCGRMAVFETKTWEPVQYAQTQDPALLARWEEFFASKIAKHFVAPVAADYNPSGWYEHNPRGAFFDDGI